MARIRLNPHSDPTTVVAAVRDTFVSRGYHWEPQDELSAVAREDGRQTGNDAVSRTLRIVAAVDPRKDRLVLKQKTLGSAYAGNGVPIFTVLLNVRFSRIVKAVRKDLEAAGL